MAVENFTKDHEFFMREAIKEAREAGERGDRPIGAVIVHKGRIVARGSNRVNSMQSDVYHAENMAIINSAPYLQKYGAECTIYTTVEPCIMCLGTIVLADISKVVFGMIDKYMKMDSYLKGDNYIKQKIEFIPAGNPGGRVQGSIEAICQ
jgi:tRNA(adenine34) deaminase